MKRLYKNTGMILEGGGSKGVFTSGVLDYFTEQGVFTSYVAGVSAGACNAVDYVSKQSGRTKDCMIIRDKAYKYASVKNLVIKKYYFDMDLIFERFPNELIPFDYEEYFRSVNDNVTCELVTTNCRTGRPEYMSEKENGGRLMLCARASSSLPFMAPVVMIDGEPYMDGGLSDSIPVGRSLRLGNRKNVLVLTKQRGYRKKPCGIHQAALIEERYRKYPALVRDIIYRPAVYNRQLSLIEQMEDEGMIYVIRPEIEPVSRTERNPDTLEGFYEQGRAVAEDVINDMTDYLERKQK